MSNKGSRRGIGVKRTDLDVITDAFGSIGIAFDRADKMLTRDDEEFGSLGRRKVRFVALETTSFVFDANGNYLGRTFMSRDECDYFAPRSKP